MKFTLLARIALGLSLISTPFIDSHLTAGEKPMQFTEPTNPFPFEEGKTYSAVIHTSKGDITCQLNPKEAPMSVTNFMQLAAGLAY